MKLRFSLIINLVFGLIGTISFNSAAGQCSGVNASFSVNATGCGIPRNYTLTNNSTGPDSALARYIWRRGGVQIDTTTGLTLAPVITVTVPGVDTIWMVAIDTSGCRDSTFQIVTSTTAAHPIFDPSTSTYNYSPLWENCILFVGTPDSFRVFINASGALSNYRIVWGDGGQDSGASLAAFTDLSHLYTSLGSFKVRVISQNGSCYDTIQGLVINERIPTAGIVGPPAGGNVGCAPHTVRFINNSSNVSVSTQFLWSFGDGRTVTLPYTTATDTIYHTYLQGLCNGTVSVRAFNACGSSTATWTPIFVNDKNVANWSMNTVNCDPALPFTFFNNSVNRYCTPAARRFNWNFGDSTGTGWITTITPQSHVFPRPGRYIVTLLDSNLCGIDTFRAPVTINFTPNTGFIFSNTNGCPPVQVIVIDTTWGLNNSRSWNFGNGFTSNDSIDTMAYITPGNYNLRLTVSNNCGSDIQDLAISVWAPPRARFDSIPNGCAPHTVSFVNTSTYFNDTTVSWYWDFDDGGDTTIRHPPPRVYDTPGTYTVWLYVYDTCGVDSFSRTFTVHPKPVADFSADTVCYGLTTNFTNNSNVLSGSISQHFWEFGLPRIDTSILVNPTFVFPASDTFAVRLIVRTNQGCRDTSVKEVIVLSLPNTSWGVSPNDSVCIGTNQLFDGNAAAGSGTISNYNWNFRDGTFSSAEDTNHTFLNPGNYSVSFAVANSFGCADSSVGNIVVLPLPTISFATDTACVGATTYFHDNSNVSPGSIVSRRWDLNNDGVFDSTSSNPSYIYSTLGARYVRLEATSDFGCVNLDSNQITVHPLPIPSISVDSSAICMGDSITLRNASTGAIDYLIDFGDGTYRNTSSSLDIRYAYSDSGTYVIRVYAYSNKGCLDSSSQTVFVRPRPRAQFLVNDTIGCAPFNFEFTNTSLFSTDYLWFSNGIFTSDAANRSDSLVSADSQVFIIRLVAINTNYSCPSDTFQLQLGTSRNPIADFTTSIDSGCGPLSVGFGNTSQFASSYYWDFRNGFTSRAVDTSMVFNAAQINDTTYSVRLYAYNWQGCPDSIDQKIVVHPNPEVGFSQSNTDSCGDLHVAFTNTTVHRPGGSIADMTFAWNYGNGNTSTATDSSIRYVASLVNDTIYTIRLIGLSRYGCADTSNSTVTVYPNPRASFTMSQADSCGPMSVAFTNTSIPNNNGNISVMSFNWDFGNGITSTSRNPLTGFMPSLIQDSVYTIRLISFSEHGCPDTAFNTVRVYPKPLAFFTQSDTSGCGPLNIAFINASLPFDTSSINDMTFSWNFGNGITSNALDTTVRFVSAATQDTVYTIRLIAYSEHGCADTFVSTVRVHPGPVALFGVNQQIACAPFNFEFTNLSINSNNFFWAVNGVYGYNQLNRPDTLINIDSQSFTISLVAETSFGCPNDTATMLVGTSRNPIADFTTSIDSGCGPLSVGFGNTSQFASSYYWDFRNGFTSRAVDTSMVFNAAQINDTTYTVRLYAYNWQGCPDSIDQKIVVHPNPEVGFSQSNTDSCGDLHVAFTNTTVHRPGGSIADMTFAWNYGNGNTSTATDSSIRYVASLVNDTIYTIRLIGLSRYGCADTANSTVIVYPNPRASFTMSQADSCGPMSVAFTNTSIPNNNGNISVMSFNWDFGNGITSTSRNPLTGFMPSLIQDSVYTIRLISFSEHGCPDTAFNTVRVYPKPLAFFTQSDTSGCGPLDIAFTNASLPFDTSSINDMTFSWNFGNGITSNALDTTVRFVSAATQDTVYTIRLIAYSEHGCADTFVSTVRVHPNPVVSLSKDDSIGCDPVRVQFTGSGFRVNQYRWYFGDGDSSYNQNPVHDFRVFSYFDSTYTVKLVGLSIYGCASDTTTTDVIVFGKPTAEFIPLPDTVCASTIAQMINNSRGAITYFWDFGNGDTSSAVSPQSFFTLNPIADTAYRITMVATNIAGCRDTAVQFVVVSPKPNASFLMDRDSGCSPLQIQFNNQSNFNHTNRWYYSNGLADFVANPNAVFTNSGVIDSVYQIRLIVSNLAGCEDTADGFVRVYPNPTADFRITPANTCGDLLVNFTNQSSPNDTGSINIMTFQWDLGNGLTANTRNAASSYISALTQDSVYTVTLIGTSEHGCLDTIRKPVRVFPKPLARFTQSDTSGCGPLRIGFTNTSIPYDTGSIVDMNFQWDFGNGFVGYNRDDSMTFMPAIGRDTIYTVRLIAFSEHGCPDTTYSTVRVHPAPVADFSLSPLIGCGPLNVNFTSSGTNISSYRWDFANGDSSILANPSAVFMNFGEADTIYFIKLDVRSAFGCGQNSITRSVTVRPDPTAGFTKNRDSLCGPGQILFSNATTGANSYQWDFGNGNTSSQANPQHHFAMNALVDTLYRIRMVATSFHGCRDTAYDTVNIFPLPTANITSSADQGCTPLNVSFGHSSLLGQSYFWNLGNGDTSTSENPSTSYSNTLLMDINYLVKLRVRTNRGCLDSNTMLVRIFPLPTADFTATPNSGCGDLAVNFTNQSTPNDTGSMAIMSFQWNLGNGNTSVATNPSTTYLRSLIQDSIYTVQLIGTSEHGCRDTIRKPVLVFPKPLSLFTQSDTSGCGPLNITFTNLSIPYDTGSINDMSFQWSFGNGASGNSRNENQTFLPSLTQDTVYSIRLIAFSEHGCRDTSFSSVRVHPDPNSAISRNPTSGCAPLPVNFDGSGLNSDNWFWDFANGNTSNAEDPTETFFGRPDIDTLYNIRAWASSVYGCWGDTLNTTVIVRPDPVANFSQNRDSLCGGGSIQFSNNSLLGYNYEWEFGDGTSGSTTVNPLHSFNEIAFTDTQYSVRLIATSVYGCKDTIIKPTTIFPLPRAQITQSLDSGCTPLPVLLGNNSIIAIGHEWDFGDGNSATGDTLSYLFVNPLGVNRDFQVVLRAISVHGCEDRDTTRVRVHPLPFPNFLVNKSGICDTSRYIFSNTSAGAVSYNWVFGDGNSSTQTSPTHIYPTSLTQDSIFEVSLFAATNRGCIDSVKRNLIVTPLLQVNAAATNAAGCNPLTVAFQNLTYNATNFYWNFDDGFASVAHSPTHTFINPDLTTRVYRVQLIASNAFGCSDTVEVPITVLPNVQARFAVSKTGRCDIAEYAFNNLSIGSVNYFWDFGDGTASTQNAPIHQFPASLTQDTSFTIRLIVESGFACFDTFYQTITVNPIVTAFFTADNTQGCGFMNVRFTNLSTNGLYYSWDFGDGNGSSLRNPTYPYGQVGNFNVTLTVYDQYGCSAIYALPTPIVIHEQPVANFIAQPTIQRLPDATYTFADLSISGRVLTYNWNFGEPSSGANNTSTLQNPQHSYSDSGNYLIRLIITNGNCPDTAFRTVRLEYYFPIASFRQTSDTGCMPHTVQFTNESLYATSYRWFFGDGGQSTSENPTHTYINPGVYTVSLIAYGPGGIDDTTKVNSIVVIIRPIANFYATPTDAYMPNTLINFFNLSSLATSYQWEIEGPDGLRFSDTATNPTFNLYAEGGYNARLIAINNFGCRDIAEQNNYIRIYADGYITMPNAFTPNGDGTNDGFKPYMEGVRRENYTFRVYNRWGERIFETNNVDESWDGTFRGEMCESEAYIWQVQGVFFGGKYFQEFGKVMLMK